MESSVRGGKIRFEPSRYYNRQGKWGWFVLHPFDERTVDYLIAWTLHNSYLFTYKKGDDSWWNWNDKYGTSAPMFGDLAYKNSKLYQSNKDKIVSAVDL
ncbi:unnamed protein product [Arabidopsis thaliana]|uniref:KIB1-4 beta-propeller domain-containing protein n=1 Tax=Arabidopsis thaliana TaxID=3702 RepID=A0A5S9WX69_ARATH|nr:unnamed protein product [Arabidopsis thaliana]VYS51937.1 unnamed protein product [Arabidopsis thaliana]